MGWTADSEWDLTVPLDKDTLTRLADALLEAVPEATPLEIPPGAAVRYRDIFVIRWVLEEIAETVEIDLDVTAGSPSVLTLKGSTFGKTYTGVLDSVLHTLARVGAYGTSTWHTDDIWDEHWRYTLGTGVVREQAGRVVYDD